MRPYPALDATPRSSSLDVALKPRPPQSVALLVLSKVHRPPSLTPKVAALRRAPAIC